MLTTIILLPLLVGPPASDRGVDPVVVEAPATRDPAPATVPAPGDASPPAPADPFAPSTVIQPQPYTAPPIAPPPPARPDRPIRWRVDLAGTIGWSIHRDPAWRALDDDRRTIDLGGGIRADFRLAGSRVFLGGGVFFRRFTGVGDLHGALSTRTRVREPIAFLRVSVVVREGLDVFAQAGGGPSIVDLDVSSSESASQRSVLGMVDGLGGLALYLPRRWLPRRGASRVTGGLELAAGYTWRSALEVRPALTTEDDPIATSTTSFGTVSIRGFAWRLGLFLRFQ